jgi:hypothetical protein
MSYSRASRGEQERSRCSARSPRTNSPRFARDAGALLPDATIVAQCSERAPREGRSREANRSGRSSSIGEPRDCADTRRRSIARGAHTISSCSHAGVVRLTPPCRGNGSQLPIHLAIASLRSLCDTPLFLSELGHGCPGARWYSAGPWPPGGGSRSAGRGHPIVAAVGHPPRTAPAASPRAALSRRGRGLRHCGPTRMASRDVRESCASRGDSP